MSSRLTVFLLLVGRSLQLDPLNDFCRRFGHQTTVIDRKLYIDGGLLNWNPMSQYPKNYTNSWLLYNDLNTSPATIDMPQLNANLSKNASIPDVSGGVLWPDEVNKRFYLYGGDYYNIAPQTLNLLSYDIIYNQWEYFGPPDNLISSVSWAGSVGVSELGMGYTLGGWLSNASVPGWIGSRQATNSFIQYEYASDTWKNLAQPDPIPKAEGSMVYIPAGNTGLLVYFGGITTPYGNDTTIPLSLDTIYVFNIQTSRWYTQTATGNIPQSRARFCIGAAWAPDKSSYNIYMYGGYGFGANASGFDDLYILSLPTFTWISWWQSSAGGVPHHSLTCNVVGGQMLIMGGSFPLTNDCDAPVQWGTHNVDLGKVSGHMWDVYSPKNTSYVVPPEVIAIVGGSSLGGATATAPVHGWNNTDVSVFFGQNAAVASRTATRAFPSATNTGVPSKPLSTGAIAGIAVGGAAIIFAMILGCCCFIRRHRRNHRPDQMPTNIYDPQYNQAPFSPGSPYSPQSQYRQPVHQLPAPVPLEMSSQNYNRHEPSIKSPIYQEVHQFPSPSPRHDSFHSSSHTSPLASPQSTHSHATTAYYSNSNDISVDNTPVSRSGTHTSPSPTQASLHGSRPGSRPGARKPVVQNQTYYSP